MGASAAGTRGKLRLGLLEHKLSSLHSLLWSPLAPPSRTKDCERPNPYLRALLVCSP